MAPTPSDGDANGYADVRMAMVERQLRRRGIEDRRVLDAFRRVPRHHFVPASYGGEAYADKPLPIGRSQTISQPYIVAYMLEQLHLRPGDRVLEIGTGSGYETALLAELAEAVYTVEILGDLQKRARRCLTELGYGNVYFRIGDGHLGWPEAAPYDAVVVSAAPREVPEALIRQLREGGRLVVPVGMDVQDLLLLTRRGSGAEVTRKLSVKFVPLTRGGRGRA